MKDVILFGNGFNLLSNGCPTWKELLERIRTNNKNDIIDKTLPPTLQYENIF